MEATNQLSETKLISLDITEAKSLLMRLLCVFVSVGRRASLVCGTPTQPSQVSVPAAICLHATRLFVS
jgi:hypothetical protein